MVAGINELVDLRQAVVQRLSMPVINRKAITADVLRIDKIHATVSGNKWFKLKYALQEALQSGKKNIITFGGAYSNHLAATAYCCARLGLHCIGVVRGERPAALSETLAECDTLGMQLHFISREMYRQKESLYDELLRQFSNAYLIPEGGAGSLGVKGAADIMQLATGDYSDLCCAVGTGTMMAGLIKAAQKGQFVTGISALNVTPGENTIEHCLDAPKGLWRISYDYHFGGYARKTTELLSFMNAFYTQTGIPTDFVYTGKLLYGILDMVEKDQFLPGSRLLIIHSGGLQGNRSLPKNTLVF